MSKFVYNILFELSGCGPDWHGWLKDTIWWRPKCPVKTYFWDFPPKVLNELYLPALTLIITQIQLFNNQPTQKQALLQKKKTAGFNAGQVLDYSIQNTLRSWCVDSNTVHAAQVQAGHGHFKQLQNPNWSLSKSSVPLETELFNAVEALKMDNSISWAFNVTGPLLIHDSIQWELIIIKYFTEQTCATRSVKLTVYHPIWGHNSCISMAADWAMQRALVWATRLRSVWPIVGV